MKVKCTFLAKNVSINAFDGVTMLLFPPRIKKDVGRMLLSKLTSRDVCSDVMTLLTPAPWLALAGVKPTGS